MLKKILLIFVFITPVYLSAEQKSVELEYKKGLGFYNAKDFQKSYDIFYKIYLKKLSDIKFNFYFGRSAYETGNYETALAAFERVEIQDETNVRNKLEMARTYFMLKMYEDSENAYLDVLANPSIPKNIRTNIELALAKASKVQKKSFTYATVLADILYDSNINYGSLGDYEYSGSTLPRIDEVSDMALQAYANLVNIYDIGRKNGFAIKNSFSFYLKDYQDYNAYDVMYFSYNPSLLYKVTDYTAELVLGFDNLQLERKKYLSSVSIMPRFEFNHSPILKSLAYFKYQRKKFDKNAQYDLDAKHYEVGYGLQTILSPRSYIQGNFIFTTEDKLRGQNIYVDYEEYKFNASYANQLTATYGVDIFAQIRNRKYQDYSSGFESYRDDKAGLANIDFTMKLTPKLRLKIGTSFEYVESNQERFFHANSKNKCNFHLNLTS